MKSRSLGVGLIALASSLTLLVGSASAHTTAGPGAEDPATCVIHSLPAFVAQGEFALQANVADVIEVECNPFIYGTGSKIEITDAQLLSRCAGIHWYVADPYRTQTGGVGINVELDADGNATVAVVAGPNCQAGETIVTAHMLETPFESVFTSFTVSPPVLTKQGVFAMPSSQVEDSHSSSVATIIEAEFLGGSEKFVRFGSPELFARCRVAPHIRWVQENGSVVENVPEIRGQLDNDGNAFVIALGTSSCAEGTSLIEADLLEKPYTTELTTFTIEAPRPT